MLVPGRWDGDWLWISILASSLLVLTSYIHLQIQAGTKGTVCSYAGRASGKPELTEQKYEPSIINIHLKNPKV